ncbi:MAG: electron transport complex subunit RsxC [Clostridia bacterium]|nr:electron transport complex subunit RsxC [Clostridia bacterium]
MKTFKGGRHIPDNKHLTKNVAIELMPIVPDYYVCLSQHIGKPASLYVEIGDTVCEGQLIAKADGFISANVHSPVCGTIVEVVKRKNAQGRVVDYVHIKSNGDQTVQTLEPLANPTREQIVERIAQAGIVGMGGAGFPTAVKVQPKDPVDTLIINAAECEPYLNCDNRIMIERTKEFVEGVRLLATACGVQNVYIGIEENKPEAYAALVALDGVVTEKGPITPGDIVVVNLKAKYPQGAEKTLIYACTKRKVPTGGLPAAVGCIVNNVATAYAVWDAVVNGRPLYKRVMTLSGRGIRRPMNIEVRVGTPLASIVEMCDNITDDTVKLVMGGPMMGFTLADLDVTTTKTDSGFLALTDKEASTLLPTPCIRCGRCVDICPMQLTPLMIDFYATVGDFKNALKYGAMNCFECGSCAYVCPAKRPLVQSIRLTKAKAKEIK